MKGIHRSTPVLMGALIALALATIAALVGFSPWADAESANGSEPVLISDGSGTLTPEQALARAQLQGSAAQSVHIDTPVYWWVREVTNTGAGEHWVVHLGNTAIERARLYVFDSGRRVAEARVDLPEQARSGLPDYTIGHHMPFSLPPDSRRTIVLRIETAVAHNGLIFIKPYAEAKAESYFHLVAVWVAAGAMAALIVYNLLLGIGLRLPEYLFYVGHAAGHLLYLLTAMGIVGAESSVLERYLFLNVPGIILGVLFGALFIYRFLELPSLSPPLARAYRLFIGAVCALPFLGLVLEPAQLVTAARSSHLVLAALVVAAGVCGMVRYKREAQYVLVGWGIMVALTAKGMLGVLGVLELTVEAGVWAFWAVLFEMFFLSLALADRVRRLNREKEIAQQANEAKSAFLANMSHEIRTPLNGVLGMVDALAQTRVDERQRQFLSHIRQSGRTLLRLLDDVLEYSRVEAGKVELKPDVFSPGYLMEELRALLGPEADRKGLDFTVGVAASVPEYVLGDAGRVRQILLNLVGNALKFTETGAVRVHVRGEAEAGDSVRLLFTVEDTGIGMSPEVLPRIFSRFHQADGSIRRRYGGSGLGLAIARELVELMHGDIVVESREGQGSRFAIELTFPLAVSPPESEDEPVQLPPLRVLVVEDETVSRVVVTELLSGQGHWVQTAESGAEALSRLERDEFDLVLMDVSMPGMDGLEATRRVRATGFTAGVIGLTAHVSPEQKRACLDAGMDAVVHKPLEMATLNAVVARFLGRTQPVSTRAAV